MSNSVEASTAVTTVGAGEGSVTTNRTAASGELRCEGACWRLNGRTLRLAIWLATHQARINAAASECGQLWLTWKDGGKSGAAHAISGDLRTRL
ncbi:MAG: hypothetical protein ABI068_10490 [Ktedonobacterales bacterium]